MVKAGVPRRFNGLLLVLVIGIAVLAGLSIFADVGKLADRLAGFEWWAFAAALGLALSNYLLRFLRWSKYLKNADISLKLGLSIKIFLSGFALSITPGKLGELVKCYLIREYEGVPIARSAPLVVGERVTDLTALLLLGVIGVATYGVAQHMVFVGIALVGSGILVLTWPALATFCIRVLTYPKRLRGYRAPLLEFYRGLRDLVRPWPLLWATGLGTLAWLAECVGFALILSAFPGTDVPLGLAILIYAVTTVAGALSFLPGGLLVTEAGMTLLLVQSARGVDEPTAVAATLLIRLATLWFAVLIGLIALTALRRGSNKLDKALDAATSEADA
jgi:uncharacterized protein (TIRG00374 family)